MTVPHNTMTFGAESRRRDGAGGFGLGSESFSVATIWRSRILAREFIFALHDPWLASSADILSYLADLGGERGTGLTARIA